MRRIVVLAVAFALAGCGSVNLPGWPKPPPPGGPSASAWAKPGADSAAVTTAYNDCLDLADAATDTDVAIDQDIAASRGSDLQHSSFAGAQLREAQQASRERIQTVLSSCMERKGFIPAK
ncbi:MAG TPA: hypothetical protein VG308_05265 [Stellaceae bacterium]|jgi:hypothetical protein|nr:hypothetical protein [Stellaceae bacterium]